MIKARRIVICALMGVFMQIFAAIVLSALLNMIQGAAETYDASVSSLFDNSISTIIYVAVLSPVLEELIFRFAIMGLARRYMPFMLANICQAVLFGLYHMNLIQGIYAFVLGLFIGWLRVLAESILGCIAYHIAINACGLMLPVVMPEEPPVVIMVMMATASAAIVAALVYCLLHMKNRTDIQS